MWRLRRDHQLCVFVLHVYLKCVPVRPVGGNLAVPPVTVRALHVDVRCVRLPRELLEMHE